MTPPSSASTSELAREAQRAPEAIPRGYAVQAVRVEPVGLVYLCPVSV